ncbi:MAG TPA: RDD family protein [Steroidobacteraceae bacterium]|nr:RDD family protein [Steroidobacteraceae bacterium]
MKLIALCLLFMLQAAAPVLAQSPREACQQDRSNLCPDLGGRRLLACLRDNRDQLSSDCRAAMERLPPALGRNDDDRVAVGHNVDVPAGETADSVVAVFGSASVEGAARSDVVSVAGSTRVTGPVAGDVVSVLGSTYIDSQVSGDATAVLGSLELGPHAEIEGDAQAIGGQLIRDPGAVVHGGVQQIGPNSPVSLGPLTPWVRHALAYLRPLAIGPGLGWVWGVAGVFLALYLLLAFLAPRGIEHCVQSLELHPGPTLLASLAVVLLTPPLLILLVVTVIGIAAVPVVLLALFCAALFGKAAALAWLGGRFLPRRTPADPPALVLAVLIGGLIVTLIYLVPVLGLVVYKLLDLLGLGMVAHALILAARARRGASPAPSAGSRGGASPVNPSEPGSPASTAAAGAGPGAYAWGDSVAGAPAGSAGPAPAAPAAPAAPGVSAPGVSAGAVPPLAASTLPRAGFWIRMVALLLDLIVVGIVLGILHLHHLILVALAAYGAILWKARGATLGGIVFDLHVVRVDGRPIDWTTAIVRALGCFLSLAILGLGFFWIAFDENHQAWHDKFAGTLVVRMARDAGAARV